MDSSDYEPDVAALIARAARLYSSVGAALVTAERVPHWLMHRTDYEALRAYAVPLLRFGSVNGRIERVVTAGELYGLAVFPDGTTKGEVSLVFPG